MYERYESDFSFRIKLPNGKVAYRLEEDEAEAVKAAVKAGRPIPPPQARRLVRFGQGVESEDGTFTCRFLGTLVGTYSTLKEALAAWDEAERYERFCREKAAEEAAIDKRYYGNLTYDEDGYKVFTPQPQDA